jgi:hypothetical protein
MNTSKASVSASGRYVLSFKAFLNWELQAPGEKGDTLQTMHMCTLNAVLLGPARMRRVGVSSYLGKEEKLSRGRKERREGGGAYYYRISRILAVGYYVMIGSLPGWVITGCSRLI